MTKPDFCLPFKGFWLVFWGGRTKEQNIHHDTQSQKYAFDFIKVSEDGKFFRTTGKTCKDYFSFREDVLAAADGVVHEAVDGLRDNLPGELNSFNFIGNYVMIRHSEKLFSITGHLKQRSVRVKSGQKVKAGTKIGECGNSGYSTDPHVHFHVQDSDIFAKVDASYNKVNVAKGVEVTFQNIREKRLKEPRTYSPTRGDIVSNPG